ncbi:MAG TPA: SDR family oxidoreductase [Acidimicrobiia bacterium]|nr:SDR family oxidoreductase [Acidimicrobiia bacterium]
MSKTVVITGGTGGLGTALVRRLVRSDHRIAVTYLLPEEAQTFEDEFEVDEERIVLTRVDCTNAESVNAFIKEVAERWGSVDMLCSLVGGWAGGRDVEETDDLRFERMIDLNLRSAFYAVRAVIPHMKAGEWGRIILVGSRGAIEFPEAQAAFNIAKAGVMALGRSVATELEGTGVTANVLVPAVIDTPATRRSLPYADYVNWPTPDEIAAVAEFVLSEESGVMNGALVPVYGRA